VKRCSLPRCWHGDWRSRALPRPRSHCPRAPCAFMVGLRGRPERHHRTRPTRRASPRPSASPSSSRTHRRRRHLAAERGARGARRLHARARPSSPDHEDAGNRAESSRLALRPPGRAERERVAVWRRARTAPRRDCLRRRFGFSTTKGWRRSREARRVGAPMDVVRPPGANPTMTRHGARGPGLPGAGALWNAIAHASSARGCIASSSCR